MSDRLADPKPIAQQEQQHAERNRAAVQRGLHQARHEAHHGTEPAAKLPDLGAVPSPSQSAEV